jgi:hypothetical protein
MDEPLNAFLAAQRVFTEVVHAIGEGDWHAPTPDACWQIGNYNSAAKVSISAHRPQCYGGVLGGRGGEIYAYRS